MSYDYWTAALADPKRLQARDFKITSEPMPGFYRTRAGIAVAIWEDGNGAIVIVHGDTELAQHEHERVWMSCAMRPVTEEWYHLWVGERRWPDVDPGLAAMGDNVRTGMDEVEQIDELEKQVKAYKQIESDEQAAQAVSLRARFLELKGIVDKKREELKAPYLKSARDVDEVWMPPVKKATGCANALRALVEGWESMKRRLAREEAEAVERARREAAPEIAPEAPTPPAASPEPKEQIRAGYGRAASVRERMTVIGISDFTAALREFGTSNEVHLLLIQLAQKQVDKGGRVPHGFHAELRAVLR